MLLRAGFPNSRFHPGTGHFFARVLFDALVSCNSALSFCSATERRSAVALECPVLTPQSFHSSSMRRATGHNGPVGASDQSQVLVLFDNTSHEARMTTITGLLGLLSPPRSITHLADLHFCTCERRGLLSSAPWANPNTIFFCYKPIT